MAKYASMVKETTTTTGTGTLSLGGAVSGFRAFLDPANINDQDYVPYFLLDANGAWEEGYGQVIAGAPNQLSRGFVMDSSAGGAAITLSAGTHTVGIGPIAAMKFRRGAKAKLTAQLAIAANVLTVVDLQAAIYDTDSIIDLANNRLVVPAWASVVDVCMQSGTRAAAFVIVQINKNGTEIDGIATRGVTQTSPNWPAAQVSAISEPVAAGDYFELLVQSSVSTNINHLQTFAQMTIVA